MTSLNYKNMKYICGFSDISKIPSDRGSEIAFVGYSNSGKSSVINSISGNSKLSKTSKKRLSLKLALQLNDALLIGFLR